MRAFFFLVAASLVAFAPACSSSNNNSSVVPGDDRTCPSAGDNCQACCMDNHPNGANVFVRALATCECSGSGLCGTACQEICADPNSITADTQISEDCWICLGNLNNDPCANVTLTACQANSDCASMGTNCIANCPD